MSHDQNIVLSSNSKNTVKINLKIFVMTKIFCNYQNLFVINDYKSQKKIIIKKS